MGEGGRERGVGMESMGKGGREGEDGVELICRDCHLATPCWEERVKSHGSFAMTRFIHLLIPQLGC